MVDTPSDDRPPLAIAMEWVSRITTVVLEMVLPGLAGHWLDDRWGTKFLALSGFAIGLTTGIWHLLVLTRQDLDKSNGSKENRESTGKGKKF